MSVEAVIKEFDGKITEEMALWIISFRKAGDDVVQEPKK